MHISFSLNKFTHRNHHQQAQHNHHKPDLLKLQDHLDRRRPDPRTWNVTHKPTYQILCIQLPKRVKDVAKPSNHGPALGGHKKYCGKQINQLHIHQPKISVDSENLSGLALICSIVHPLQPTQSTSSSTAPLGQLNKQMFTAEQTTCPHCSFVFARPGGLAKHLKKNVCLHKNLQLHEAIRNIFQQ